MAIAVQPTPQALGKGSVLDGALRLFGDVRPGEGVTTVLMLINIFLILICYSVIKTVREPLILLGGGAEVRSYAAAGQAVLLMGFVPFYSWFASRVDRVKLLVGVTVFFLINIELFALAVRGGMPYVGVAFFIWVGIFNISLIAQFWSYANDLCSKEAGERLFPIITMGMTLGAPLGSLVAGRLFAQGLVPQVIIQVSAALLGVSLLLYLWINAREQRRTATPEVPLAKGDGFSLVFRSGYLRLVALLIILLNIVNTTGEYLIARLLTLRVDALAAASPEGFNKQAYIGAFSGNYQFWVNVAAFILQAFVTSRLVKRAGLRGALLALPLIALGGYSVVAAGAGFALVRWIKTAENATDYSIMNTARQLLWLPTSREEKYKAKQAIDTFFVRGGDVLSAGIVYLGTSMMVDTRAFAAGNVVLTLIWIGVALLILKRHRSITQQAAPITMVLFALALASPALAQGQTREAELAARQAERAQHLHPYELTATERHIMRVERAITGNSTGFHPYVGSVFSGGAFAVGPAYQLPIGGSGMFDAHAAWSIRNYKLVDVSLKVPDLAGHRVGLDLRGNFTDAPKVAFYGVGNTSLLANRTTYLYRTTSAAVDGWVRPAKVVRFGGGAAVIDVDSRLGTDPVTAENRFVRGHLFGEVDRRTSPGYTRSGGLYRVDWYDYRAQQGALNTFRRIDAEARHFVPLLRANWIIALRALASVTATDAGNDVPYFLLPDLGGGDLLRGFRSWRFRDRNRLLLTGEYRWTAGHFVDMAVFVDSGKVAARRADLDLDGLTTSYGIGVRFHAPAATIMRVELARTRESLGLIFAFGESF